VTSCSQCGVEAGDDESGVVPLGWMFERQGQGPIIATCPACTRVHARAIEGKLDASWW
jgi:hypothetical protein